MEKEPPKTITFNNPPLVVRAYTQQWLNAQKVKKDATPAEVALMEDIVQLIDIAISVLKPGPAEPGNDNN